MLLLRAAAAPPPLLLSLRHRHGHGLLPISLRHRHGHGCRLPSSCFLSPPPPPQLAAIRSLRHHLSRSIVAPLCFAAISRSVNTPLTVVASGMAKWLELYSGVLMVRVLLSWFPNIPWERQPLQAIRDMCDPYLNLFRNIIPPLFNALDVSPLLAFLVLGMFASILNTTIAA